MTTQIRSNRALAVVKNELCWFKTTVALASLLLVISAAAHRAFAAEPAKPADALVDTIGVNTHLAYPNAYTKDFAAIKAKLGESGIRHIRDGAAASIYPKAKELFEASGVRTTLICGRRRPGAWPQPLDSAKLDEELAGIKADALPFVEALEGPNEYDISRPPSEKQTWAAAVTEYQKALYAKAKADPELRKLPVIGPSLTSVEAYQKVGDLSDWLDYSCVHHYLAGRHPGNHGWGGEGYGSLSWAFKRLAAVQSPTKPAQFTECGYCNAVEAKGDGRCSEAAEAKYLPRMYAEYFRHGEVARAFKYELLDERDSKTDPEANFGLLRHDLSEKPAFAAIKNLIALLKDPGPPGPAFTPASLDYALEGQAKDVRAVLLQKRDHDFYLLLWQEVPSWDVAGKKDIPNSDVPVSVRLTTSITAARACLPGEGTEWKDLPVSQGKVTFAVPDRLLVVRLTPAASPE